MFISSIRIVQLYSTLSSATAASLQVGAEKLVSVFYANYG